MKLIDTHAHLNFSEYSDDLDETVVRSKKEGVLIVNASNNFLASQKAVKIAENYPECYAAIGLHPINLTQNIVFNLKISRGEKPEDQTEEDFDENKYKNLLGSKTVAIGEIGLDYYWKPKSRTKFEQFKEKQKQVFLRQFKFAQKHCLPVIIHCRMAHEDIIAILKEEAAVLGKLKGVIHCFTGTMEQAENYLKMGFYIGLNGIIFKMDLEKIIEKIPIEKILLETDCPYLTPSSLEGRNEPSYLKLIAQEVVRIKKISFEEVAEVTTDNAQKLFALKQL